MVERNNVRAHSFVPGDQVLVRREAFPLRTNKKLCRKWLRPYLVLNISGEDLVLRDPNKQKSSFVVHINRIKRFIPESLQIGSESESEDHSGYITPTGASATSGQSTPDANDLVDDIPPIAPDPNHPPGPELPPNPLPPIPTP
jgi:hypothetical protein